MNSETITALLVVDPYNDFISEGGRFWPHVRAVAEHVGCVPNMLPGYLLDGDGPTTVHNGLPYGNVKVGIRFEDHRKELARSVVVERLEILRLVDLHVFGEQRERFADVVAVPRSRP